MNVTTVSPPASVMPTARPPEASEGPGPDHDGDKDDGGIGAASNVSPAPPTGMGAALDTKA